MRLKGLTPWLKLEDVAPAVHIILPTEELSVTVTPERPEHVQEHPSGQNQNQSHCETNFRPAILPQVGDFPKMLFHPLFFFKVSGGRPNSAKPTEDLSGTRFVFGWKRQQLPYYLFTN